MLPASETDVCLVTTDLEPAARLGTASAHCSFGLADPFGIEDAHYKVRSLFGYLYDYLYHLVSWFVPLNVVSDLPSRDHPSGLHSAVLAGARCPLLYNQHVAHAAGWIVFVWLVPDNPCRTPFPYADPCICQLLTEPALD